MTDKPKNRKPLTYGKKLYISEFLAEWFIRIVAFISIAVIVAIFYYVFQESTYAFKSIDKIVGNTHSQHETKDNIATSTINESKSEQQNSSLEPESYVPETYSSSMDNSKPESYQSDSNEDLKPQAYNSDSNNDVQSNIQISGEGKLIDNQEQNFESSIEEKPVNVNQLILPNDYIDNKPEYIWQPISEEPKYSIIPLIVGALKVTFIGIIIAAPLAILAAIFTVAFAPRWMREIIKPSIEILAGFPSVVLGFFCLMTLASVIQELFGTTYRLNSFVGGIGIALAVIPIIYTVTEDALSSVPKFISEASLALGASRWQTSYRVLLPAAIPGVFAAIILGFGRAFGETMIVLMATGNAALVSFDIFESVRTLSATIGAEMAEVEFRSIHYGVLFLIGSILFVVTFSLNALAEFYIRKRLLKKFQGI